LHGKAYKFDRAIVTERHYKDLVTELQKRRAQVELCGATSRVVVGATKDLIPRIKVNRNAMARTTQLVQEGLVKRVRQSTAAWAARELPELAEIAKMLGYKLGLTCSVTSEEAHSTPLWGL
jgi:hypothetical protein